MLNVVSMMYMVAIGLEAASCSIIGQLLGKGDVALAKKFMLTFVYVSSTLLLLNTLIVYLLKDPILACYTSKTELLEIADSVYYFLVIFHYPDAFKGMLKGVIKALNRVGCAAWINLSGHWCINITI